MSALGKLAALFVGDEPVPVGGAGRLAEAPDAPAERSAEEASALVEAARCRATADDLDTRLTAATTAVATLTDARSAAARGLAMGETTEAAFAQATAALDAAVARREALEQLLAEAREASQAAYGTLRAAQAPRLMEERRQRIEAARLAAEQALADVHTAYAALSSSLSVLADRAEDLAPFDATAANGIAHALTDYGDEPLTKLTFAGWTTRKSSPYVPGHFSVWPLVPPKGV